MYLTTNEIRLFFDLLHPLPVSNLVTFYLAILAALNLVKAVLVPVEDSLVTEDVDD